jgi:hypothetical protein
LATEEDSWGISLVGAISIATLLDGIDGNTNILEKTRLVSFMTPIIVPLRSIKLLEFKMKNSRRRLEVKH